jgi:hypothetical protein
VPYL